MAISGLRLRRSLPRCIPAAWFSTQLFNLLAFRLKTFAFRSPPSPLVSRLRLQLLTVFSLQSNSHSLVRIPVRE